MHTCIYLQECWLHFGAALRNSRSGPKLESPRSIAHLVTGLGCSALILVWVGLFGRKTHYYYDFAAGDLTRW